MKRREFVTLVGAAAAGWPLVARAQQPTMPVIGFLNSGSAGSSSDVRIVGFSRGLNETGFVEGRNVMIQYGFSEGHYDRLPSMVAEFVNRKVVVIAATGGVQTALAAKPASATVPVIFANGSDPVQFGLVESLSRPGGNMTGVSFFTAPLEAKRLGLLSELVPAARIFGVMINPTNDNAESQLKDIAQAGLTLGRPIIAQKASDERQIDAAFETFAQQRVNALLVSADPYFFGQREKIVALSARYNLAAIYEWREYAQAGGLASYGTSLMDNYRLAGVYVGRVLKGEKPADLPVIRPTKFEFVINLKTAKALSLDVAHGLLTSADEVIE
jgi:putative tryptophan/tyrosine transport system substrate-binding protein